MYVYVWNLKKNTYICILFQILYRLLQNNGYGSLCYTVDLVGYLFYIELCIYVHSKCLIYPFPPGKVTLVSQHLFSVCMSISIVCVCVCVCVCIYIHLYYFFRFHIQAIS